MSHNIILRTSLHLSFRLILPNRKASVQDFRLKTHYLPKVVVEEPKGEKIIDI
jgi:hypothetical protein